MYMFVCYHLHIKDNVMSLKRVNLAKDLENHGHGSMKAWSTPRRIDAVAVQGCTVNSRRPVFLSYASFSSSSCRAEGQGRP